MQLCGFEIPTNDIEASCRFFNAVFGWTARCGAGDSYTPIPEENGALNASLEPSRNGSVIYFEVDNIAAALETAADLGAEVEKPETEIVPGVSYAKFIDDQGNPIGLWSQAK